MNQKHLMTQILNIFETGTPAGNYAAIAIYPDGPNDIRQITYGRSQTTEYGNLHLLVQRYVEANGSYSEQLAPFVQQIGKRPLAGDRTFISNLLRAGRRDPVMRAVQDTFFDELYFAPAMRWAGDHGLELPLSALVVYDSWIHSGSILNVIRKAFAQRPPSAGGEERAWTTAYVNARYHFLATHRRPIVRATVYRPTWFAAQIARGNWNLDQRPLHVRGVEI
ncbi:MAG: chitosanase [Thermoanaerobaculia bacterium]